MWIRKGVKLIEEEAGDGPPVERQQNYLVAIRITLSRGEVVRHPEKCLSHHVDEHIRTEDDGYFQHHVRIDRENLVAGIFYAVQGMNVGGYRKVAIAPHLAYGETGVPDVIPPNAKLTAEIKVLEAL
ncbi:MAG: FKBP-type peptidyl-prolyl cis-trans isomerase [Minwuiales bacterium]|nr:FKBP-type peptidyl-prolyl cis-trans isomerase [Minwuiales bacterium]